MKWNEIPFDSNEAPEVKALEFDLQFEENSRDAATKRLNREYPYDMEIVERRGKK